MKRYIAKPPQRRAIHSETQWWNEPTFAEGKTVYEPESSTFSGLLDHEGNELHRVVMRIGFKLGDWK